MTLILIGLLALAVIFLILSLIKKVVKLAFTAAALLLLVGGIWYLSRQAEVPDSVRQAGRETTERIKKGAGQAIDKAVEAAKESASQAIDQAAETAKEKAGQTTETSGPDEKPGAESTD